jgi:hypothetical protein
MMALFANEGALVLEERIRLGAAGRAQRQGDGDGINARAWTFRGGFRPCRLF